MQTMRIGLISDTHIPLVAQDLPSQVMEVFQGVDLILHAGDIYTPSVIEELERIAPIFIAEGDDDYGEALRDNRVKRRHVLKLEGKIIWLMHIRPYTYTAALMKEERDSPDIVVFGHEHIALVERRGRILYVNPGSPTFLNYQKGLGTVGILDIKSGKASAFILQL